MLQDIFNDPERLWEQRYNYTLGFVKDRYWFGDTAWNVLNKDTNVTVPLVSNYVKCAKIYTYLFLGRWLQQE